VIVLVMGVCGSGKTTVGQALARELGWRFLDADDFHPEANVAKMARGVALIDDDRWPWFDRVVAEMRRLSAMGQHAVVACSALKQAYRDRLASGGGVHVVYLKGDAATIEPRLTQRKGHFMPASLLPSQFAALEEPRGAIVVDIAQPIEAQVAEIARALRERLPA
jgi:gluconokinase